METMRDIVLQEMHEERFNRKHIDAKIKKEIEENDFMVCKIDQSVKLIQNWMAGTYYASKMARINQLKALDLRALATDIFVGVAYYQVPELFTSASAQIASRLNMSTHAEAIVTVAELLALLCETDAFDIIKESREASLTIRSRIPLSSGLIDYIDNSQFLPPMVCKPLELTHNFSSGYLTHNDSLVLGTGTHHPGDLCLDVLNKMNEVPLALDLEYLSKVEEEPTFELDSQDKRDQWLRFKKQSYLMYSLMAQAGNRFYMTHKVDKRGRIYSCGYHINPQGAPFKKAMLEFADEEIVEGVPT